MKRLRAFLISLETEADISLAKFFNSEKGLIDLFVCKSMASDSMIFDVQFFLRELSRLEKTPRKQRDGDWYANYQPFVNTIVALDENGQCGGGDWRKADLLLILYKNSPTQETKK